MGEWLALSHVHTHTHTHAHTHARTHAHTHTHTHTHVGRLGWQSPVFLLFQGTGGSGGGVIYIEASHSMEVDGAIKADGSDAIGFGSGGGAGGSIWLKAKHFSGMFY